MDSEAKTIQHLISIGDPLTGEPYGVREHPCWQTRGLRLEFDDIERESPSCSWYRPVTQEQVAQLIQFSQGIKPGDKGILIHCQAGISRSTAAAVIVRLCQYEQLRGGCQDMIPAVLREVQAIQPLAKPNRRMIWLTDRVLGLGGRLIQEYQVVFPNSIEFSL